MTVLRIPTLLHSQGLKWLLFLNWSKMGNQRVPGYSLRRHLKVLDLKFIFFEVLSMSHHHDVINQRLHRHRQKTKTVNFMNHGQKMTVKTFLYVILYNYLSIIINQHFSEVSDGQEISIRLKF